MLKHNMLRALSIPNYYGGNECDDTTAHHSDPQIQLIKHKRTLNT